MNDDLALVIELVMMLTVGIAVFSDLRHRRIYNAVTFPAMLAGLALHAWADGLPGISRSTGGLLLGGLLFFIPVAFGSMGAGDLKLLAAIGALGGPAFVFWCAIYAGIAGGVMALITLLARRRLLAVVGGMALDVTTGQVPRATSNIRLPYAVPIACGVLAALVLR